MRKPTSRIHVHHQIDQDLGKFHIPRLHCIFAVRCVLCCPGTSESVSLRLAPECSALPSFCIEKEKMYMNMYFKHVRIPLQTSLHVHDRAWFLEQCLVIEASPALKHDLVLPMQAAHICVGRDRLAGVRRPVKLVK